MRKTIALVSLAALPAVASATTGYFAHGFGMKSVGMGGVGIALPQDSLAAASNPAGMAWVGSRMDLGVTWFRPIRQSEISGNIFPGVDGNFDGSGKKNFLIPEFGYNRMVNPNLALGVSVYGNGGMNTTYNGGIPLFGNGKAGVDLAQVFIAPTAAYKVNEQHAVGASLNLAYQRFKADGIQNFAGMTPSGTTNNLTNRGYDDSTGWGVRLGWVGQLTPGVTLGASWQSKTKMSAFDKYKELFAEGGDFDIPENYGIGIAVKATPKLTIAADVVEIKYGDVKSIANPLASPGPLGAPNGPGFGWRDMTVFKLGAAYEVSPSLTLRAGYVTGDQPIPASETLFNILAPGIVEDHLTLGATWTLENKAELTVGYMHAFKKTINGVASIPPGAPPGFGGGNANLRMHQDAIGIAYGWKM